MTKGTGSRLQHNVHTELEWDPSIDATKIGVSVDDGVVTLTGHARTYADKIAAERITKRVRGVKAVANDIEVRLPGDLKRDDTDIAKAAVDALRWNSPVPSDKIKISVTKGWVTLTGDLDWQYQKRAAEDSLHGLKGVRGISNNIHVKPTPVSFDVKKKIVDAFRRSAEVDAKNIAVEASDGEVTLRGKVRSWAEHDDAVNAAWNTGGVAFVKDELLIRS